MNESLPTDSGYPMGMPSNFQNDDGVVWGLFFSSHAERDSASVVRGFVLWLACDERITSYRFWIESRMTTRWFGVYFLVVMLNEIQHLWCVALCCGLSEINESLLTDSGSPKGMLCSVQNDHGVVNGKIAFLCI